MTTAYTPLASSDPHKMPTNEMAEAAVLGAILLDSEETILKVLEIVDADAFSLERHRKIFRAMVSLAECGSVIDPVTLVSALTKSGELAAAGGDDYILVHLLDAVPIAYNVEHHARLVRDASDRRRMIGRLTQAAEELRTGRLGTREVATDLQSMLLGAATQGHSEGFVKIRDDLWPLLESIEALCAAGPNAISERAVPTGYPEIDTRIAGGFERGEFVVIAGVPGGCKTALAMNIALNSVLANDPRGALFVSAEMTRRKLHMRNLAAVGRIDFGALRAGQLRDDDYPRLARAAGILTSAPLWVDQTPTPAIEHIVAKCRKEKAEHPEIKLVVVDFVQLVQRMIADRRMRHENRAEELTVISYTLKGMAKELDVAMIATCQVDASDIEKRADKRPKPGDARWSQGMREAADVWISCYRDQTYNPDPMAPDLLELAFDKVRDAEPFRVTLNWQGNHQLLSSPKQRAAA